MICNSIKQLPIEIKFLTRMWLEFYTLNIFRDFRKCVMRTKLRANCVRHYVQSNFIQSFSNTGVNHIK
jgi:hypothetical protein